jgi:prophage antirepressor-like protein
VNEIQQYVFEGQPVRVTGTSDTPYFAATDVCRVLGIDNPSSTLARFPENEKGLETFSTPGGLQKLLALTEAGLYRLVFRSYKPEAERFRVWVLGEVLPSIRKTGSYTQVPATAPAPTTKLSDQIRALLLVTEQQERIEAEQQQQADRLQKVEQKLDTYNGDTGYRSVLAYLRTRGVNAPLKLANLFGRMAAERCRDEGHQIGRVPDERWGEVNSYPLDVLDRVHDEMF